jgi:hypothetical protein
MTRIKEWWDALTPEERKFIIEHDRREHLRWLEVTVSMDVETSDVGGTMVASQKMTLNTCGACGEGPIAFPICIECTHRYVCLEFKANVAIQKIAWDFFREVLWVDDFGVSHWIKHKSPSYQRRYYDLDGNTRLIN